MTSQATEDAELKRLLSKCHKAPVSLGGEDREGSTRYYRCGTCHQPCDLYTELKSKQWNKGKANSKNKSGNGIELNKDLDLDEILAKIEDSVRHDEFVKTRDFDNTSDCLTKEEAKQAILATHTPNQKIVEAVNNSAKDDFIPHTYVYPDLEKDARNQLRTQILTGLGLGEIK